MCTTQKNKGREVRKKTMLILIEVTLSNIKASAGELNLLVVNNYFNYVSFYDIPAPRSCVPQKNLRGRQKNWRVE